MSNQEITEYRQYIKNLDRDSVLDISRNIDKEKYPEKWESIKSYLNENTLIHRNDNSSSFISQLWKGDIPLVKTFWLFWLLPAVAFPILQELFTLTIAPVLGILYVFIHIILSIGFTIYQIICIKGLWSSATKYDGKKVWSIATKTFIMIGLTFTLYAAYTEFSGKEDTHDPGRTAEKMAIPTDKFPLAGFYKDEASDDFGFAIGPNEDGTYYISFCGPGGCFKPGTYLSNTALISDPNYEVLDNDTIKFKRTGSIVKRAPGNMR